MQRRRRIAICTLSQTLAAPTGLMGYFAQLARFLPQVDAASDYHFVASEAVAAAIGGHAPGAKIQALGWDDSHRALRLISEHLLLGSWLHRSGIDVLFMANAGVSPLFLPRSVRLVQGIFAFHQFSAGETSGWRSGYRRRFFGRAVARSARIVLNSNYSAELLMKYAPDAMGKSRIVPHGLDPALFHAAASTGSERDALARLGVTGPYFLYVSQMYPYKDVETAVSAFGKAAPALDPRHLLVLVGRFDPRFSEGEPYRRRLIQIADALGVKHRIVMLDSLPVALLRAAYRGAVAYIQPSLAETFGKTSLEAMACGCPVIAADAAATPEVLDGAGLLFPPRDASACAALMVKVATSPAEIEPLIERGLLRAATATLDQEAAALAAIFAEAAPLGQCR